MQVLLQQGRVIAPIPSRCFIIFCFAKLHIIQPCNAEETRKVVEYAVDDANENVALRFIIGPSPRKIQLPNDYKLTFGQGTALTEGGDAVMFAYGPVMLHEALLASSYLLSVALA